MVSPDRAVVRLPILPTPPAGEGRQCKLKKLLEAAWLPPAADTGQGRGLLGVIYEGTSAEQRCHLFRTVAQGCLQEDSPVPAMVCLCQAERRRVQREGEQRSLQARMASRALEES